MSIRDILSNAIRLGGITYRYIAASQGDDYFVHLGHENGTTEIQGKFGIVFYKGEANGKQYMAAVTKEQQIKDRNNLYTQTLYEILPDGKFKYDGSTQNEVTPANFVTMKSKSTGSPIFLRRTEPEKLK